MFAATGLLLLLLSDAAGQPPAATVPPAVESQTLTLEQALTLAEQYSPYLRAAKARQQGALGGITTARAYPNPEFTSLLGQQFSRFNRVVGLGAPGFVQHYSVSQPLELSGYRKARIQAAELGRTSSDYSYNGVQLDVRGTVKQAFYDVLRRRGEIEVAQENLKLIEDLRRRIQVQVEVGEAARLELVRAEAEVATAQVQVRSAQLRLVTAVSGLRAAIAAPLAPTLNLQGSLGAAATVPTLEDLRTEVLSRHPALKQAQVEIQRAEARLRTELALRSPQPTFHSEYEQVPDAAFYRFGISLPIPIWNKREGPIQEATAALNEARAQAEGRRVDLTAALERAYGLYEVATQQLSAFERGVLRESEAALQAAEAAFRFGERGIIEVLDAQRVLRNARSDFLNAQFDRQAALIEIEQLRAADSGARP